MNSVRKIAELNARELEAGVPPSGSWHADYRDTAFVFFGGLPFELSEGDVLTIFSQYGEPVYINLVRDKETGKSRGFGFLKYQDQRSTDLAVDNLSGAVVLGRTMRVDHTRYKLKEGERIWDNTYGDEAPGGNDSPYLSEHEDTDKDGDRTPARRRHQSPASSWSRSSGLSSRSVSPIRHDTVPGSGRSAKRSPRSRSPSPVSRQRRRRRDDRPSRPDRDGSRSQSRSRDRSSKRRHSDRDDSEGRHRRRDRGDSKDRHRRRDRDDDVDGHHRRRDRSHDRSRSPVRSRRSR